MGGRTDDDAGASARRIRTNEGGYNNLIRSIKAFSETSTSLSCGTDFPRSGGIASSSPGIHRCPGGRTARDQPAHGQHASDIDLLQAGRRFSHGRLSLRHRATPRLTGWPIFITIELFAVWLFETVFNMY